MLLDIAKKLSSDRAVLVREPTRDRFYVLRRYAEAADFLSEPAPKSPTRTVISPLATPKWARWQKPRPLRRSTGVQPDFHLVEWTKDEPIAHPTGSPICSKASARRTAE